MAAWTGCARRLAAGFGGAVQRGRSLRSYLVALVLAGVLPILLFAAFMVFRSAELERASTKRQLVDTAWATSLGVDRELTGLQAVLTTLADASSLTAGDLAGFYRQASRAAQVQGGWIMLSDAAGRQILNTRRPYGAPLPGRVQPVVAARVFATEEPVVSDLFRSPLSPEPVISIDVPVLRGGKVIYSLGMAVPPEAVTEILREQPMPPAWIAAVFDRQGITVARTRQADKFVGRPGKADIVAAVRKNPAGWFPNVTREGIPVYNAFARSELTGWSVIIGVPQAAVDGELWWSLALTLGGGLVLLLLGTSLAVAAGRRIVRPVRALATAAAALGHGEEVAFTRSEIRELDGVGETLATAARQLRERSAERARAAAALREAEERFRATFEQAAVGVAHADAAGKWIRLNQKFCDIVGYSREELQQRNFLSITHPDDLPADRERFERLKAGEIETYAIEKRFLRKDGTAVWVDLTASVVRGDAGDPKFVIRIIEDITERRRAETALRDSEAQFRTLADAIPQLAWMARPDGWIFWYNRRWYEYTGTTFDEMQGWGWRKVHDPEALPQVMERWQAAVAAGTPFEMVFPLRGADGVLRPFLTRIAPVRDSEGRLTRWFGTNTDITVQREAEAALRRVNETLEQRMAERTAALRQEKQFSELVLESSTEGIVAIDTAFRHTVWNAGLEAMTGLPRDQVLDRTVTEVFPQLAGSPVEAAWRAALDGRVTQLVERAYTVAQTGRTGYYDGSFAPLHGPDGIVGALALLRDTTEHRRAEEALRQAQRMEAVGQLTGGVAHDFNNLLTVIAGNLDLLGNRSGPDHASRRLIDAAHRAADRGARLTQQLLAFARRQTLRPEIMDLSRTVGEFEGLLRRAVGEAIEVEVVSEPSLWQCRVDPAQFESAILNLAVNARDAMPSGGRLTIAARNIELHPGDAEAKPGPYVLVSVTDTGQGIPPELLGRVFEPFFTTKEIGKGSGLGLSQVYGFVRQSDGTVRIESRVGQGTTIEIYLPKAPGAAVEDDRPSAAPSDAPTGSETILLVEDDRDVLGVTAAALRQLGYRVLTARDGIEAFSVLERGEPIDLLLTDVVMPHGVSGLDLARRARQQRPTLKVLLASGYAAEALPAELAADGGFPLLGKPFRVAQLAGKVRDVLARGTG